jgi:hypothetical protein
LIQCLPSWPYAPAASLAVLCGLCFWVCCRCHLCNVNLFVRAGNNAQSCGGTEAGNAADIWVMDLCIRSTGCDPLAPPKGWMGVVAWDPNSTVGATFEQGAYHVKVGRNYTFLCKCNPRAAILTRSVFIVQVRSGPLTHNSAGDMRTNVRTLAPWCSSCRQHWVHLPWQVGVHVGHV